MKKFFFLLLGFTMLIPAACDTCSSALADLLFNAITSNKQANNGQINIGLGETIQFTSSVINEANSEKCKSNTSTADGSKMKAILDILDIGGQVLGTLDTLYGVNSLSPESIYDVLTKIKFNQEGYYELNFGLDALNNVKERDENNNAADVFKVLWELLQVIIGKSGTVPAEQSIKFNPVTGHYMIKVGSGKPDALVLQKAMKSGDFHNFASFQ